MKLCIIFIIIFASNAHLLPESNQLEQWKKKWIEAPTIKEKFEYIKQACKEKDVAVCEEALRYILSNKYNNLLCYNLNEYFHFIGPFLSHEKTKIRYLSANILNNSGFSYIMKINKKKQNLCVEENIEITPYIIKGIEKCLENQDYDSLIFLRKIINSMLFNDIKDKRLIPIVAKTFYYKYSKFQRGTSYYYESMFRFYSSIANILASFGEEGYFYLEQIFRDAHNMDFPAPVYREILYAVKGEVGSSFIINLLNDWPESQINSAKSEGWERFCTNYQSREIKSLAMFKLARMEDRDLGKNYLIRIFQTREKDYLLALGELSSACERYKDNEKIEESANFFIGILQQEERDEMIIWYCIEAFYYLKKYAVIKKYEDKIVFVLQKFLNKKEETSSVNGKLLNKITIVFLENLLKKVDLPKVRLFLNQTNKR